MRERKAAERAVADVAADRRCVVCDTPIAGMRVDALACGARCRMRWRQHHQSLRYLAVDPEFKRFKPRAPRDDED